MTKLPFGYKLCKISNMPFQAFKWKAGPGGRYKETMVSYAVAAERNICQTCLLDMKYGLPVGVRDSLLGQMENQIAMPASNVGQQYFYEQQAQMVESGQINNNDIGVDLANVVATRQLDRFARILQSAEARSKTAFRNLPKLCSFWLHGTCTRVLNKSCPFRPCCGAYAFPEIAGSHRELCAALVDELKAGGPAAVQKTLSEETRMAIKEAGKGNREDAMRKRVQGDDDLTKKYLGKMGNMVSIYAYTHIRMYEYGIQHPHRKLFPLLAFPFACFSLRFLTYYFLPLPLTHTHTHTHRTCNWPPPPTSPSSPSGWGVSNQTSLRKT
jgi:hypothetical protein